MRVGNFSVYIPEGRERSSDHVEIPHGRQYTLVLGNHSLKKCDAEVWIDGTLVDTFRLDPHNTTSVQGPTTGDRGRFTAFARDSADGQAAGLDEVSREDLGLIRVVFKPGRDPRPVRPLHSNVMYANGDDDNNNYAGTWSNDYTARYRKSMDGNLRSTFTADPRASSVTMCLTSPMPCGEAAGTGLTGRTDQRWRQADRIIHDPSAEVTINLRLVAVAEPEDVRPLRSKRCCGKCGCRRQSNPVPAPVD